MLSNLAISDRSVVTIAAAPIESETKIVIEAVASESLDRNFTKYYL
jgi:hypothetical protein